MKAHIIGYPRIGSGRELKKAEESFWKGKNSEVDLLNVAQSIRSKNWSLQKNAGLDWVCVNDFSYYDQVLDMCMMCDAIPQRFRQLQSSQISNVEFLFAMARGYQRNELDIKAMEMTKWFDTNYHYIVPEFTIDQQFSLNSSKVLDEFKEAKSQGFAPKPVLLSPVSFLFLGKEKGVGFSRFDLFDRLLPIFLDLLDRLSSAGAVDIQIDEPCLSVDVDAVVCEQIQILYKAIQARCPKLKIILANYFECYGAQLDLVLNLPINTLHLDVVRCPKQLDDILAKENIATTLQFSLGVVDGHNIWKNDFENSIALIDKMKTRFGSERILVASSCSLLHVPCDLDLEKDEKVLSPQLKNWMAFAKQKLDEIVAIKELVLNSTSASSVLKLEENKIAQQQKRASTLIHDILVEKRIAAIEANADQRKSSFAVRKQKQKQSLPLPLFPTTTIGSFPQTKEVRSWRQQLKKGTINQAQYDQHIANSIVEAIRWQEEIDIDVLVHGEFERNDMVEYFGEQLKGFVFTQNGWVQSYGSRCVKPPIIFGDVSRPNPMTVQWTDFAQHQTQKFVKGMLTGPVTILQWSFVRNDQPRSATCLQIALAIRDEVCDLEKAGIKIIQIDEPAIREGLPLRKADWANYLQWAIHSFRVAASGVEDETQIHTHMCYSEFNDIIEHIAAMDADVITIECSRSQMELLDAFVAFHYPNDIGPGVYDIHSPRIPSQEEMVLLLEKAESVLIKDQIWVNPDCGLKTRGWEETKEALQRMVLAARQLRAAEA